MTTKINRSEAIKHLCDEAEARAASFIRWRRIHRGARMTPIEVRMVQAAVAKLRS